MVNILKSYCLRTEVRGDFNIHMENSIVKKIGSVDVKITPDFCS